MKPLRTAAEEAAGQRLARIFETSPDTVEERLETFPRYARRKTITRFITLYELFKLAQPVKGSIVECGVYRGFGLMTWAHLSAVIEPTNLTRRIYGFDTFAGFPSVAREDLNTTQDPTVGELRSDSFNELSQVIDVYDTDRFIGHIQKLHLIRGDIAQSIPQFVAENQHLVVSLLFLDVDLYEPTLVALRELLPRMPKGAVLAFDELDNPKWPGETRAVLESVGLKGLRLRRFDWDPYIGYAVLE